MLLRLLRYWLPFAISGWLPLLYIDLGCDDFLLGLLNGAYLCLFVSSAVIGGISPDFC